MQINSDYKELLSILNAEGVKYLVIGGYAEMVYTEPRYTKDIDIWIERTAENGAATFRALSRFGAHLSGIKPEDEVALCRADVWDNIILNYTYLIRLFP